MIHHQIDIMVNIIEINITLKNDVLPHLIIIIIIGKIIIKIHINIHQDVQTLNILHIQKKRKNIKHFHLIDEPNINIMNKDPVDIQILLIKVIESTKDIKIIKKVYYLLIYQNLNQKIKSISKHLE